MAPIDTLSSAACLVLAGTFAVAAIAKARHPRGTAASFHGLGLPAPTVLARIVPAVEASVGVTLLASPRVGGPFAVVLLGLFSAVLVAGYRRRTQVRCACFGSTSNTEITPITFARNMLLMGAAVVATAVGRVDWSVPVVLSSVALAVLGACGLAIGNVRRQTGGVFVPHARGAT